MTKENPNALKHMYGKEFVSRMMDAFSVYPQFNKDQFSKVLPQLVKLEMKPRVLLVRDELFKQLPNDFPEAMKVIMAAVKTNKLKGFDFWPVTEYIQAHGLGHPELSLDSLKKITVLFTGEFAVRPFIIKDAQSSLEFLLRCATDKNYHVRRWASEGSRPRLPWGAKLHNLIKDPTLTLPILNTLKFDPELYVGKSVANHLNDITKDHPRLVVKLLSSWKKDAKAENIERVEWIIRHALRTLIKKGNPDALKLLGIKTDAKLKLSAFSLNQTKFKVDDRMQFEFKVKSLDKKTQKFVIDYKIHFSKAAGKSSDKVFKLKVIELPAEGEVLIQKNHHLKVVTTRKFYPGDHYLEIMINGVSYKKVKWDLKI